jgi:hypothetical protein
LLEIYFQNPQFGYYFLVLTSQRLLENIKRLDSIVAQNKAAPQVAAAVNPPTRPEASLGDDARSRQGQGA